MKIAPLASDPDTQAGLLKIFLAISLVLNMAALAVFYKLENAINLSSRVISYFDMQMLSSLNCRADGLDYYPITDRRFRVSGIAGFDQNVPSFDRLDNLSVPLRKSLRKLARYAAGGRVRFMTDSKSLSLDVTGLQPAGLSYPTLSEYGASGIDVYVDGQYIKTVVAQECQEVIQLLDRTDDKVDRLVEIFLPNYSSVQLPSIGLMKGSSLQSAPDYRAVVAFYGTSITQGEGVSRPSLSYPALVSRKLDIDFYNFGFSGNARGDTEIASILANLDVDLIFLEYSRQARKLEGEFGQNLNRFYRIIRRKQPLVPIVVSSSLFDLSEHSDEYELRERDRAFLSEYKKLRKKDRNIHFVDGKMLLGGNDQDGLADGTHPNTYGAVLIAERLSPVIEKLILH